MSAKYINPNLPGMVRNLWKSDPSERSVQIILGLAADLIQELIDLRANRSNCPQPCEHLSQHDAREGRTCPEHPCTCTDQSDGSES